MIATALIQGGQLPVCFAKPVADFLAFGSIKSAVNLDDIPDYDIIESLKKVLLMYIRYVQICLFPFLRCQDDGNLGVHLFLHRFRHHQLLKNCDPSCRQMNMIFASIVAEAIL